ncbi:MAG: Signal recognition particle core component [Caeruleum heppii]|nr:MAG: Signal recognition particle core component [Caeruleum heppii]
MSSGIASAAQSLASLLRQVSLDDHEEVLRAANAVLKKSKNDVEAHHVKAIALVKLDRYDDALQVLDGGPQALGDVAHLAKAYALYKAGQYRDAEVVAKSARNERAMRHVEAQAAYRLENFTRTAEIYADLLSEGDVGEESDLQINGSATAAQLAWSTHFASKKPTATGENLSTFETTFNAACRSIALGGLSDGAELLQRAKVLCSDLEDLTPEEKQAELLQIITQQIYVLTRLRRLEDAHQLSSELSIGDIPDLATRQIAQSNVHCATTQPLNPYLAHRMFHATPSLPKNGQHFEFQSTRLKSNAHALDLLCLKYQGLISSTSDYLSKKPSPTLSTEVNSISILNGAATARNQPGKAGLKAALPLLHKRPGDMGLLFLVIQLCMSTQNVGLAVSLLDLFVKRLEDSSNPEDRDVRFVPGLVALVVSVHNLQGARSRTKSELSKGASYWQHRSDAPSALLHAAGASLLQSDKMGDVSIARGIYERLRTESPNDHQNIAGSIASNARVSDEIDQDIRRLTPVAQLVKGIDAKALEEAGIPTRQTPISAGAGKKRKTDDMTKGAKKRVRKSRLPKDYDPQKPPDPERWLPLRDRSTYRPRGRKGKQKAAALTQGGTVDAKVKENEDGPGRPGAIVGEKAGVGSGNKAKKKKSKGAK